jgi:uncharacterized membrane protein YebE (DUF533 family)
MTNFGDLIGAFLQNTMTTSGDRRLGNSLDEIRNSNIRLPSGRGGAGDLFGSLTDVLKGGLGAAVSNPASAGGIGAVLGSLIGGGSDSVKGALGGGVLAVLASVAMKSLTNAGQPEAQAGRWTGGDMPLGLRAPEGADEEQALQSTAKLVLKGMINAAKADGEVSTDEVQRIAGKLREAGMDEAGQQWVMAEMRQPLDVAAFAAEIPSQEVAAQVYAASLLAVEVDTEAERRYLQELAQRTGLHPIVVQQIHRTMGVA